MEVTFFVGDVIENKLYASCTIWLQGIGTNENKAMISAFSKLNPNHKDFGEMLEKAKNKIIDFYTNHCAEEISKARPMPVNSHIFIPAEDRCYRLTVVKQGT